MSATPSSVNSTTQATVRVPSAPTLQSAAKLAISEDKPVLFDYWLDSIEGSACVGQRENKEKLLVKSAEEYTSPIVKVYKVEQEFIIQTENSIYIVSASIPTKRLK